MLMIKYGDDNKGGVLTNPVGAGVKGQKSSIGIQETIKEFYPASLATIMGNRGVVFVPAKEDMSYEERVSCIERCRSMVRKLERKFEMSFQVGIGGVTSFTHLYESYKEAAKACRSGAGKVVHILDIPVHLEYGEGYPIETERAIFEKLEKGETDQVLLQTESYMMWLRGNREKPENNHKLKVLEMVLLSEQKAYLNGGMTYNFSEREGYLESIIESDTFEELGAWFDEKMAEASNNIANKQHEYSSSLIKQAIDYIRENYTKELTLDEVSKQINISPYYFSKIFKEETGTNFVEFFTKLRIDYACELLKDTDSHSIKEICGLVGYSDPNYFSRIFKKWTNDTPTEYREREM
jgi:two-component system response regulator YesN